MSLYLILTEVNKLIQEAENDEETEIKILEQMKITQKWVSEEIIKKEINKEIKDHAIKSESHQKDTELIYDVDTFYPDTGKCRFCQVEISCGYDDDEWYHCQICHNVYDGNAQCVH